jgi:hypothetical protein
MPNHDTTLTLQLIRVLEPHPEGLSAPACWETLAPRQTLQTVYATLNRLIRQHIVVRRGRWSRYTYALRPDFRQAFAGRAETQV